MEKRIKVEAQVKDMVGIKKNIQVIQIKNCVYLSTIASAMLFIGYVQANRTQQMEESNFGCVNLAEGNSNLEIMPVRQELRNAVEAMRKNLMSSGKKSNNYLTWIDVAHLENVIDEVNNYLTLVEAPHLCMLRDQLTTLHAKREGRQHITDYDINECKRILDRISDVIGLQSQAQIQVGPYMLAE